MSQEGMLVIWEAESYSRNGTHTVSPLAVSIGKCSFHTGNLCTIGRRFFSMWWGVCLFAWGESLGHFDVNILGLDVKGAGRSGIQYAILLEKTLVEVFKTHKLLLLKETEEGRKKWREGGREGWRDGGREDGATREVSVHTSNYRYCINICYSYNLSKTPLILVKVQKTL